MRLLLLFLLLAPTVLAGDSIWLVFPCDKLNVIRDSYTRGNVRGGEVIASVQADASGTRCFTGSSRITRGKADALGAGNSPWLEIHDNPAFLEAWEFPRHD